MNRVKALKDLRNRPTTMADIVSRQVPPRGAQNIRRGHFIMGMRDINHVGWKPWEDATAGMQRVGEQQRFERSNRFYSALEQAQALLGEVRKRESDLQAAYEEMEATNEELQATNEEMEATNEELQATTEELERVSAYRQTLMESMRDILMTTDPDGVITNVNPAAERITGYSHEELVGQPFRQFFTEPQYAHAGIDKVLTEGEVSNYDLILVSKDGRQVALSYNATALRDPDGRIISVLGSARDVTERRRMEEALRGASTYNRSLIDASLDPLVTIDPDGKITDVNAATEAITGCPREELIGTDFSEYFTEPEKARAGYQSVFKEGSLQDYALEIRHRDGHVTPVLYNASVYRDEAGEVMGVFAAARDITERKRMEEVLAQQAEKLASSNAELEQFAYIASHDLQEPLRMVSSYTQLLAEDYKGKLDAEADEYIAYVVDGVTRMQALINGLLEYSRVGREGNGFEPIDTEAVFEQAVANLEIAIEESSAVVTHDHLPTVMADATQLVQLFQNLIGNAIKFRSELAPNIHIGAKRTDGEWLFSVQDNGIGIDPQYTKRIFVMFQRLHGREEYPGTGIGLTICKKIVEHHGGTIWVESEPGKGSTFYFTIPRGGGQQ